MAIRQKVEVSDFRKIASQNEFFLWHFLQKEQHTTTLSLYSFFDEKVDTEDLHQIKHFLDNVEIPYFESYVENSIDFLMDFGISSSSLFVTENYKVPVLDRDRKFNPLFMVFHKFKQVGNSFEACYCLDYLLELTMKLNPKFILESKF